MPKEAVVDHEEEELEEEALGADETERDEEEELPESEEDTEQAAKEAEAKARRQGWIPESEWDDEKARKRGVRKPARFKTAEEFLRDAESNPAMQRERARNADKTIARLEGKIDLMNKVFNDQRRMAAEAQKRAYEKGLADARARKREAIAEGDVEKVETIEKEIDQLNDQIDEVREVVGEDDDDEAPRRPGKTAQPAKKQESAGGDPDIDAWINRNRWFSTDPVRKAYMVDVHAKLVRENPGVPEADLLDDAKKEVQEKFPDRFGINPARRAPAATRSAANIGNGDDGRRVKGRTWADVPARDKEAYERTRKMIEGQRTGEKYTKEDFLKEYDWS